MTDDPRTSDAATGLPPLEDVDPADAILLLAWHASEGLAASPHTAEPVPVRFLSVRGLLRGTTDPDADVEWGQVHVAVPVEHAVDVAADLAKGTTEQLGGPELVAVPGTWSDEDLERGRRAVEDALVDLRDRRISILTPPAGLVIRERDGTDSPMIRLTITEALRIALTAMEAGRG